MNLYYFQLWAYRLRVASSHYRDHDHMTGIARYLEICFTSLFSIPWSQLSSSCIPLFSVMSNLMIHNESSTIKQAFTPLSKSEVREHISSKKPATSQRRQSFTLSVSIHILECPNLSNHADTLQLWRIWHHRRICPVLPQ
jgi:hypothetical protein